MFLFESLFSFCKFVYIEFSSIIIFLLCPSLHIKLKIVIDSKSVLAGDNHYT